MPTATAEGKGLMSASHAMFYSLVNWGTANKSILFRIARMEKTGSGIWPLGMLLWQRNVGGTTTFVAASVVNRTEGAFAATKNLGPGTKRFDLYYKEDGDWLSVYLLLPPYICVCVCFANLEGVEGNKFLSEQQASTDTTGMTKFTAA